MVFSNARSYNCPRTKSTRIPIATTPFRTPSARVDIITPMRAPLLLLLFSSLACAQSLNVRTLNGNTGRPLPNQQVSVQFFSGCRDRNVASCFLADKPATVTPPMRLITDSNGEARFTLPSPTPDHMDVRLSPPSKYWHCDCWVQRDTSTVLHDGTLSSFAKWKVRPGIVSRPGEITFAPTPFGIIERFLSRIPGE